jgi:hypothetical protein
MEEKKMSVLQKAQARTTLAEQYQAVQVAQETLTWARARLEMARERLSVAKIMQETKHQGA